MKEANNIEKQKRIAIISISAPPASCGGVASSHYNLFNFFRNNGYNVKLFTYSDNLKQTALEKDIIRSGLNNIILKTTAKILNVIKNRIYLKFIFYGVKIETLYQSNGIVGYFLEKKLLWSNVKKYNPHIVIVPDRDFPHLYLGKNNYYIIQIEHHNPARFNNVLFFNSPINKDDIRFAVKLGQKSLKKVSEVVCVSNYMKRVFNETYIFNKDIKVVHNIFNIPDKEETDMKSLKNEVFYSDENIKVIYIPSGGSTIKGERYVFSIVQYLLKLKSNIRFYISGEITENLKMEFQLSKVSDKIYMPGKTDYATNMHFVNHCDICVSPCLAENYSMALLEAMSIGLPVVAFDVGGNQDIVSNDCGALVEVLDIYNLCLKTVEIIRDEELLSRMSDEAIKKAILLNDAAKSTWIDIIENSDRNE